MRRGLLFGLICATTVSAIAQKKDFDWVKPAYSDQGNAPTVVATNMVVKPSGDIYLAGSNGLTGNGVTYGQPCLAKYGSDGEVKWVNYFDGGNNSLTGTEWIVEDSQGDIIAMYYGSALNFDGTPTPVSPKYVIVKFDTAGTVKWVNYFGGNQINIKAMDVSNDGNVAIMIGAQFVSTVDTTVSPGNSDAIAVLNGTDGDYSLIGISAVTPSSGYHVLNNMYPHGPNSMVCISTEPSTFSPIRSYISELDLTTNTIVSKDTVENIFHTATVGVQSGDVEKILDFDPNSNIGFVSGRAHASGVGVGIDSVFGVNSTNQSMFLAKIDFNTGEVLKSIVYYTPGSQEGVQRAVRHGDEIAFFVVYRDTLRNTSSGEVYTSIDTLPNNGPHPHCLIQNFDLDLELNYHNQSARLGAVSTCRAAGFDQTGALYMLHETGSNQYFDHYFLNSNERSVLAKIGETAVGVAKIQSNQDVIVFPNPVSDVFNVKTEIVVLGLRLINLKGQFIKAALSASSMSVQDVDAGVYFLEIITPNGTLIQKMVVQ